MAIDSESLAIAREHHRADRLRQAEGIYREILNRDPGNAEVWHLLGVIAHQHDDDATGIQHIVHALKLDPRLKSAWNNLGLIHQRSGNVEQAIGCYQRALEIDPQYADATFNLGLVHDDSGSFREARALYDRALQLKPNFADARLSSARLRLLHGDFDAGWQEFESRWDAGTSASRKLKQPQWDGQPLEGKTIRLHAEQGFGDTIQFVRYVELVKKQNPSATVVLECQRLLMKLLPNCRGIDHLVTAGDAATQFDLHAPLLSLPRIFGTRLETIPADVPYLFADDQLVVKWRERLREAEGEGTVGLRIGINWQGGASKGEFRKRDIPLDCFAALRQVPGTRLISLQKGVEENTFTFSPGADFDTTAGAFMDTAAVMKHLDLVISSDTSVAHLAGALGVPVWVALPYVPDWRWLLDRTDSPWYPTMRLFRQKRAGDWVKVFEEIGQALNSRLRASGHD